LFGIEKSVPDFWLKICSEETCNASLEAQYKGKELEIKYTSNEEETNLIVGNTKLEGLNPLKQFAVLSNGFIATVENENGKNSIVKYYNKEGKEVHSYTTNLDVSENLASNKGVYGSCTINEDKQILEIIEYEITDEGLVNEKTIGTFEDANCQD
jgi:hypothetical protein